MNEWKELKIDNLPSDILTGNYEFESSTHLNERVKDLGTGRGIILAILNGNLSTFYYRKPEPLPPTHEEIMTLFFLNDNGAWERVSAYCPLDPLKGNMKDRYHVLCSWVSKDWFTNRESAVFPPEAI